MRTERLAAVGERVRLEYDSLRYDRAGGLLAYVFRADDDRFVNAELVTGGYATVLTRPPNVRYVEDLMPAGRRAREAGAGSGASAPRQGS